MVILDQSARLELRRPRDASPLRSRLRVGALTLVLGGLALLLWHLVVANQYGVSARGGGSDFLDPTATSAAPTGQTTQVGGTTLGKRGPTNGFPVLAYFKTSSSPPRLQAVAQTVNPPSPDKKAIVMSVVELLQGAPPSADLQPPLPPGTKALAVFFQGKDLYLDMSTDLVNGHTANTLDCYCSIQALTNTLTGLEFVDRVKLLVSGKERLTLLGHFDLMEFWTADQSLVSEGNDGTSG